MPDFGLIELTLGLFTPQKEIQQVIVRQVHQHQQPSCLANSERGLIALEEPFDEQVVLQQAAPTAPTQATLRVGVERSGIR